MKPTTVELTKAAAEEKRRLLSEAAVVIVAAAAAVAPEPLQLPKLLGRSDRDAHKVRVKKRVSKTTNLSASSKNKAFSSSNLLHSSNIRFNN